MKIDVNCPDCSASYQVPAKYAGRSVKCAKCQGKIRVPSPSPEKDANDSGQPDGEAKPPAKTKRRKKPLPTPGTQPVGDKPGNDHTDLFAPGFQPSRKDGQDSDSQDSGNKKPAKSRLETPAPLKSEPNSGDSPQDGPAAIQVSQKSDDGMPDSKQDDESEKNPAEPVESTGTKNLLRDPVDDLLPPKFNGFDPEDRHLLGAQPGSEHKVILPDGKGGFQQIDSRVVHVEHGGNRVQLYSAPKSKKDRKRLIQNIIAILIGIGILTAAFFYLLSL